MKVLQVGVKLAANLENSPGELNRQSSLAGPGEEGGEEGGCEVTADIARQFWIDTRIIGS